MRNSKGVLATITVLTSNCGDLTKTFYVDANGEVKKNSTPNFSGGSYEVVEIRSLKELKELRRRLKSSQAFMFSTPTNGTLIGSITTKNRRFGRTLSRSLDCFRHPAGGGVLPIDYDPRSGTKPLSPSELVNQLFSVFPALRETQFLWATSAGSSIYDAVTGREYIGVNGQRVYILVKDGSDITRALNVLATRLWLAGHGWIKVSKSGQKLKRTLVDLALANAVQPDFAAGAVCHPPLEQRSKQKLIGQGEPLDTRIAIPDLVPDELVQLAKLYADAEAAVAGEVKAARELWLREYGDRVIQRATAAGKVLTEEEIAGIRDAAVTALDNGILTGDFLITLADGTQVTVADILNSPARYHGALCLDPLEPEYDDYRVVGKIFIGAKPFINSFAHGGQAFKLIRQQCAIEWRNSDSAISVQETNEVLRTTGSFYDYGNCLVHVESVGVHVLTACRQSSLELEVIVIVGIESAARLGELLKLDWRRINLDKRTAQLLDTKNGEDRSIPLSSRAVDTLKTLQSLPRHISGKVFYRWKAADSFNKVWVRACARAGIEDLRFHDLRHEACSRLADKFHMHELMKITGHKSAAMLARYYHPRAEDLAKKLG